jgi:hypothetical protein
MGEEKVDKARNSNRLNTHKLEIVMT